MVPRQFITFTSIVSSIPVISYAFGLSLPTLEIANSFSDLDLFSSSIHFLYSAVSLLNFFKASKFAFV